MILRREVIVHAFVECRTRTTPWWLYARPTLTPDDTMAALLVGAEVEPPDRAVRVLGVPADASLAVRDEYTWRVAGPLGGDAPNIVSAEEAERWLRQRVSHRWKTAEPFARVTDPRWSHGTWLDRAELTRLVGRYEELAEQPAPATFCALVAMVGELERDFVVRVVLWLERRVPADRPVHESPTSLRDHLLDLERARTTARLRRRRDRRALGEEA